MKNTISLRDVAEVVSERVENPSENSLTRFVGLEHYDSGELVINRWAPSNKMTSAMKAFRSGDVLIARRNVYLKRASMVEFDGITSGDSIVLRKNNSPYGLLLPFIVNTSSFWNYANTYADGTMSKRLSVDKLLEYSTIVPEEGEIETISSLLWSYHRLSTAYQKLLIEMDNIVKSRFVEMLTPYAETGKVILIQDMVAADRPVTYGIVKPGTNYEGGVPVVRVKDFTDGIIHTDDMLHTSPELNSKYLRSTLLEGDVLLSIGGTIGRVAIVPKELEGANITQHTARISLKQKYDPLFVKGVLESPLMQEIMQKSVLGVAQVGLNLKDIRLFPVPDLPQEGQEYLAEFYRQTDKSKFAVQKMLKIMKR